MATLLKKRPLLFLLTILVLGGLLRFYGLNWDQGHHLHPDERAIVMFTIPINFPDSIKEFLSPASPLNPRFFAYGNFPLYLLKTVASFLANFDPMYAAYEKINLVGRSISAIADLGTLILLYFLTKKLFSQTIGLVASFFYAISVFPIQAAHFFAVDTLLTFFIILTLYQLIRFYDKPSVRNSILIGIFFGLSLATKTSAIPLIIAIVLTITLDFILLVIKQPHKPHIWFPHMPRFLKRLVFDGVIIAIATIITFATLQPYAIIDFQEFLRQTQQVSQVTHNAFAFPFTLQYVGKTPYFYELKNIFLWGQGPILATLSFLGTIYISLTTIIKLCSSSEAKRSREVSSRHARTIIILTFFFTYFFVVGKFAVGFMRYLLPIYPLLCLFGATFVLKVLIPNVNRLISKQFSIFNFQFSIGLLVVLVFIGSILIWPLSFMHIYTQPNTRVLASEWIYKNIPPDKTIAREHWDDGMPIGGNIYYTTLELPIYEMENPTREAQIYQMVQQSDYIIIASNRLYVPLQRISKNCQKWNLPPERCSHNANRYYERLFGGELGFQKVAEFAVYPTIPILNIPINDQGADENFTVFERPKVMIFKKILF